MHRLPPSLVLAAAVAILSVPLTSCASDAEEDAGPAAGPAGHTSADERRAGRALGPVTTTPPTTTVPPATSTTTSSTTAAPPPPTTVTTSPPAVAARVATPAADPPPTAPLGADEAGALRLINQERVRAGLTELQMNGGAQAVARGWSAHMAGSGLAHNPDLSGDLARAGVTGWATIGENVGYASRIDQVHSLFMGSAGHRANILKAAYSQVGVGVVASGGSVWVTLAFVGY